MNNIRLLVKKTRLYVSFTFGIDQLNEPMML